MYGLYGLLEEYSRILMTSVKRVSDCTNSDILYGYFHHNKLHFHYIISCMVYNIVGRQTPLRQSELSLEIGRALDPEDLRWWKDV